MITATGNITGGNINTGGVISSTGNVIGGNLTTGGALSVTGNANIGNIGTGIITATGNITGANLIGPLASGNSNISITPNSNINMYVAGNITVRFVVSDTGVDVTGTLSASGNANVGNLGTTGVYATTLSASGNANVGNLGTEILTASGNIGGGNINTTGQVVSSIATGTAPLAVTSTTRVTNLNAATAGAADTAGTVTTNAQPNITSTGTLSSLSVTGNIISGNVYANSGTIGASLLTGTLTTNAQPNITSTGTLASLSVSGNANIGNIGTAQVLATANITTPQLISNIVTGTAPLVVTSTTQVANLNVATAGNANTAGTVTTNAQPNITSTGTLSSLSVSGNANIGNIGTGIITATGNITGANLIGTTLSVSGNTTLGNVSITGNLAAGNIIVDSIVNGNSNVDITNPNGNITFGVNGTPDVVTVTDTILIASNIQSNGTLAGTLTTGSQPNITSLGILTSLSVSGVSNLGPLSNVRMSGGSSGQLVQTDGSGNLSFTSVITQVIPGTANTLLLSGGANNIIDGANIKFNDPQLAITGTLSVTGNANVGNIGATNIVGTLSTAAQPNITSVGDLTGLRINGATAANGTLNAGNTSITGTLSATGNITGNFFIGNGSQLTGLNTAGVSNGNSNVNIPSANGNVNISAVGNTVLVVTGTGANITGTLSASGNANVDNIGANNAVFTSISGNGSGLTAIAGANVTGTVANATYAVSAGSSTSSTNAAALLTTLTTTGTTYIPFISATANGNYALLSNAAFSANLANGAITATTFVGALSGAATSAGTVTTNAQPNITSVGLLTGLTIGNATANSVFGNGTITLNNGLITGNGNGLSQLVGANVTGTVANATYAVSAGNATNAAALLTTLTSTGTVYIPFISSTANGNYAHLSNANFSANLANGAITAAIFVGALSGAATTAGTVTTNAQPNITSTGTLASLSVSGNANIGNIGTGIITASGNITGANIITTGYHFRSVGTGISAAGATQGTATALTKEMNIVSTVVSGANGVVLPTAVAGMVLTITNTTANSLLVYPAASGIINSLAANAAFTQGTTTIQFIAPTATQWYTVGATYA